MKFSRDICTPKLLHWFIIRRVIQIIKGEGRFLRHSVFTERFNDSMKWYWSVGPYTNKSLKRASSPRFTYIRVTAWSGKEQWRRLHGARGARAPQLLQMAEHEGHCE